MQIFLVIRGPGSLTYSGILTRSGEAMLPSSSGGSQGHRRDQRLARERREKAPTSVTLPLTFYWPEQVIWFSGAKPTGKCSPLAGQLLSYTSTL